MLRSTALLIVIVAMAACGGHDCPDSDTPGHIGFEGGDSLTVRIADDEAERVQGLKGVTSLPPDEGMAFLFGGPTEETFWMKDTLVPLSIAFVSNDTIVTIRDMEPCAAEPCATYASAGPYTLAVEADQGWFARHGISEGDRVESFDGPACA